jgi:hypothetical protein
MPSKKKSRGKARRATKGAAASTNRSSSAEASQISKPICRHANIPEQFNESDEVLHLYDEYIQHYNEYSSTMREFNLNRGQEWFIHNEVVDHFYAKYEQLNKKEKMLFHQLLVSKGTKALIGVFADVPFDFPGKLTFPIVLLLVTIELRDRLPTVNSKEDHFKLTTQRMPIIGELVICPKKMTRYLHKRNACSCLKDIYQIQKSTIGSVSQCHNCQLVKSAKEIKLCSCGVHQYCSRECQLEHWPQHKDICKVVRGKTDLSSAVQKYRDEQKN